MSVSVIGLGMCFQVGGLERRRSIRNMRRPAYGGRLWTPAPLLEAACLSDTLSCFMRDLTLNLVQECGQEGDMSTLCIVVPIA